VAGYFLGQTIPDVDKYLLPIIAVIILLSVAPTAWHLLKERENREALMRTLKDFRTRQPSPERPTLKEAAPVRVAERREK
jgi:hypothetical protein